MKRYGFRLAAGMAAAGLGSLGIYQFIPAKSTDRIEQWRQGEAVAAEEPPAPLALTSSGVGASEFPATTPAVNAGGEDVVYRANNDTGVSAWGGAGSSNSSSSAIEFAPQTPEWSGDSADAAAPPDSAGVFSIPQVGASGDEWPQEAPEWPQTPVFEGGDSSGAALAVQPPMLPPGYAVSPAVSGQNEVNAIDSPDAELAPMEAGVSVSEDSTLVAPLGAGELQMPAFTQPGGADGEFQDSQTAHSDFTAPSSDDFSGVALGQPEMPVPPGESSQALVPLRYDSLTQQADASDDDLTLIPSEEQRSGLRLSSPGTPAAIPTRVSAPQAPQNGGALSTGAAGGATTSLPGIPAGEVASQVLAPMVPMNKLREAEGSSGTTLSLPAGGVRSSEDPQAGFATISGDQTSEVAAPSSTASLVQKTALAFQGGANAGVLPIQTVDSAEVLAEPGIRSLEGPQAPSVVVHKRAPGEVRVGKPCEFVLSVRNVGSIPALDVRVFDRVPEGCELVETVPPAESVSGILAWQLGDLQPGEERSLILKMTPLVEGELGSVARVIFEAASSVRTIATRPDLKLVQRAPQQVLIGQQIEIDLELMNNGSGSSQNVILKADLPEGLEHASGKQIESPIGMMPPGDKRRQLLRLRATRPGVITNTVWLVDADGTQVPSSVEIEVISPAVEVALEGPSLRYLERQATYQVQIGNAGTADATNLEIAAFLDKGLKFVSTESAGQYDPSRHAVFWSLEQLPPGQAGTVALTLLPVEAGAQEVRLEAHGDLGIAATSEKELTIETLAELNFTITDDQDPIETGSEATYIVRVQNAGTRDDTNVRLEVQLPHPALELIGSTPAAQTDGLGRVVFEPIARIPAKGEQVFKIQVRGTVADTHLVKATVVSDQSKKPVTKEESTTVYADK